MKYFCFQGNEFDCGFASLKMLLAMKLKNKSFLYLPKPEKRSKYTFADLCNIAQKQNVELVGYQLEFAKLRELPLPSIIQISGNHTVVLTKVKKNTFYVSDPAVGRRKLSESEMQQVFSGYALVVKNFATSDEKVGHKQRLLPASFFWLHLFVAICIACTLAFDFYLMNDESFVPFVFIVFAIFISLELFENWYLLRMSEYFDETYIPLYFSSRYHQNYDDYRKYLAVKSQSFSTAKTSVIFGSLAVVLAVLLAINDLKNLVVIAILATYKVVEMFVCQEQDDKRLHAISEEEAMLFDNQNEVKTNLLNLNHKANQHVLTLAVRNCLFHFVIILLSVLMMFINHTMSANYAVFHFGVYFVVGQGLELVFNFVKTSKQKEQNLAQFYDKCHL